MMPVYIRGLSAISIQDTFGKFPQKGWQSYEEPYVRCIEPDFKQFLSPIALRRMSPIIKRAIATSIGAIRDSGIENPEAIISGTGLGCIEDTEKFLWSMIENEEQFLQPTFFIQSTHNTVGSQIAIHLKNHAYNNTYSHRGISFDSALTDAWLMLRSGAVESALVGGFDEMTPHYFGQLKKVGFWKDKPGNSLRIWTQKTPGSFAGEGSTSIMLSVDPGKEHYAEIKDMTLLYRPENIGQSIVEFLAGNGLRPEAIDLFMTGVSGDVEYDHSYFTIARELFPTKIHAAYKNLCGEFFTAPAFGLCSAAMIVKKGSVPEVQIIEGNNLSPVKNVLYYNQYRNKNHSLILLK